MDKRFCDLCEREITNLPFFEIVVRSGGVNSDVRYANKRLHICKQCHNGNLPDYLRLKERQRPIPSEATYRS